MLTPGQDHDLSCAEPLIENADPEALIGDKAYDADPFVETLTQRGITPVIPPKANRNIKRECDFALYCERNLIERFYPAYSTAIDLSALGQLARSSFSSSRLTCRGRGGKASPTGSTSAAGW